MSVADLKVASDAEGELAARSLRAVWHPCTQMQAHESLPLIELERGEGPWLVERGGARLLDAISSWWVNLFGHANPRINAAIVDQLGRLEHAMLAGCTHAPVVELSERLGELTGGMLGHAFYGSDGASAVEIALKMSHHAWRNAGQPHKRAYVCVRGDYHGETLGALGVTDVAIFRDTYADLLRPAQVAPSPDARTAGPGEGPREVAQRAAQGLARILEEGAGRIAAVIVEPLVQCASGMAMHDPAYLSAVRELCTRHGVHLIADEIAVGCGRTGTFFACEQAQIWPDFLCLSKGISGGYLPLSVVLTREEIYRAFYAPEAERAFLHSHSYTGNPLACRAALACLDIFRDDEVLLANRERAASMGRALAGLASDPRIEHFRHLGMIWAFDVRAQCAAGPEPFARRYFEAARRHGALLRPIGRTVYLMPPYVLGAAEQEHLAHAVMASLDDCLER
jgi:adenosylmethionine-8-amino-7-oxononanoate aminotransferase